jgi:hypothetical protein
VNSPLPLRNQALATVFTLVVVVTGSKLTDDASAFTRIGLGSRKSRMLPQKLTQLKGRVSVLVDGYAEPV